MSTDMSEMEMIPNLLLSLPIGAILAYMAHLVKSDPLRILTLIKEKKDASIH